MIHTVLLCDADRRLLAFYEGLLRHARYQVATAQDMSSLSIHLRSTAFSLVIAELAFPDCGPSDAVSVTRRVATLRPRTPILAHTSNTDPTAHRKARVLGAWEIAPKPASCTELLGLVRSILEDSHPENLSVVSNPAAAKCHSSQFESGRSQH